MLLVSLEKLVVQLRQKKQEATKLRKKAEDLVKESRSAEKRSMSGLQAVDKKIESQREESSDVSTVLLQKNSQLASIGRLVASAEERLLKERESVEQAEQEIEFANTPAEKGYAEDRLRLLNNHVSELVEEINRRQKTAKKILVDVERFSDAQSKITTKIQKQSQSKPSLRYTKVVNHTATQKSLKELERRTKAEKSAQKLLDNASLKLKESLANKKKAPQKKKTSAVVAGKKKKAAATKKKATTAAKRKAKTATKRKAKTATKRKAKTATKRKAKTATKRKAKTATKRKATTATKRKATTATKRKATTIKKKTAATKKKAKTTPKKKTAATKKKTVKKSRR